MNVCILLNTYEIKYIIVLIKLFVYSLQSVLLLHLYRLYSTLNILKRSGVIYLLKNKCIVPVQNKSFALPLPCTSLHFFPNCIFVPTLMQSTKDNAELNTQLSVGALINILILYLAQETWVCHNF